MFFIVISEKICHWNYRICLGKNSQNKLRCPDCDDVDSLGDRFQESA